MNLTRRGWTVVALLAVGTALAVEFGTRSLAAAVVPLALALLVSLLGVARVPRPTVDRHAIVDGHVDDRRTVTVGIETDRPVAARVVDTATTPIVVYPPVHPLTGRARHDLNLLPDAALRERREEFERLREYGRGDSLRDVHWKASAKHDELIVKSFVSEDDLGTVSIAAEAAPGGADRMATAVASVARYLLDAGVSVELAAPGGAVDAGSAGRHREDLLTLLARTGPGEVDPERRAAADVVVTADVDGATVATDAGSAPFAALRDDADAPGDGAESTGTVTGTRDVAADGGAAPTDDGGAG
ncbi:hypothetical protein BRD17_09255 [Halobacteriales archaeon SW_7_68_16]|nr:MAG: hypothetical protein BRD17_09255 [Halobacteriales archaeon SW_7_68_16]